MDKKDKQNNKPEQELGNDYADNHLNNHKPFNDAMDHLSNMEGYPTKKPARLKSLPLPIRVLGYFFAGVIILLILTIFVVRFVL